MSIIRNLLWNKFEQKSENINSQIEDLSESDYDFSIDITEKISRSLAKRRNENAQFLFTSTPEKYKQIIPVELAIGHGSANNSRNENEIDRIKQFVDVKTMINSLQSLEKIINERDIRYDRFKAVYLQSTRNLFNAINQEEREGKAVISGTNYGTHETNETKETKDELLSQITLISIQILKILIENFKPVLASIGEVIRLIITNEQFQKLNFLLFQILLTILSILLESLKLLQPKQKRATST